MSKDNRSGKIPSLETEVEVGESFFDMDSEAFQRMYRDHGAVMYIVDLEAFRIIDANQSALKFYGYDIDTMRTKRIPDLNITADSWYQAIHVILKHQSGFLYSYVYKLGQCCLLQVRRNKFVGRPGLLPER